MLSFRKYGTRCAALFLVVAFVGCGDSGPAIVPVTGTLTYKGHPVTNALVFFVPEDGNGRPSQGPTDAEGRFKVSYTNAKDGVLVGKHKVWVKARPTTRAEQEATMMGKKLPMARDMTAFFAQ